MPPPTLQASGSALMSPIAEKAADISEQREIEAVWKEVHLKVVELAGGDPKRVQSTLDINSVLKYIDNVQASDKKKSEEFGTFKRIVNRTLQCINTVGGIVAAGASEVFAPAGMCYNALTFVIQAWQGYEGMFANLAELLEKCTEFLERLESYDGRMDARLKRVAVQNLRLFVEICDRTIKLRKKHSKWLAFTKQLFLNDNGIQDLLGMMDRLNAKESLLVNAQTYKLVSDSAGDIKLMLEGQEKQKKEDDAKKWRRTIAKALGFPGTTLDSDGEPIPTWQRTFDARKNQLVDETGKWILDNVTFLEWSKATAPTKPVVVLGGRNGSGKTSVMANTVRYMRKMDHAGPTSRIVTAYFFMEGEKRKSDDEDASSILELVSRTLLWQIATSYEAMTKSIFQLVERSSDFDGSRGLWQQLFINNKERMNPDTTFYLFIDGLDETLVPLIQTLASVKDNKKARVFLTARPQMVSDWLEQAEGAKFSVVPISDHNGDDIDKYIISRMNKMPILKDATRPGISEWRQTILETLRFKCAGDYFKLNTSLNALAKVDLVDDINEVLANADKTRTDQIDAELRRLNNIRTIKEIQEINEIIMWVETSRQWFSVPMMEDIISVKHWRSSVIQAEATAESPTLTRRKTGSPSLESTLQETAPAPVTLSLLPFCQKLAEKYPIFAVTDSGVIDWRSPEIKDRVPSKALERDAAFNPTASGPQIIQESEISIIRHFLNNVCPQDLYNRFDFEQFFNAKLGAGKKEYICLDPDNASIKIVITCLTILTKKELRDNKDLRHYAVYWLLDHFQEVDLSAADRDLKAQVGPLLVEVFTSECGVDSMFWPFDLNVSTKTWDEGEYALLSVARGDWLYSMSGVQEVSRWLHDSSVTKYVTSDSGMSFIKAVKESANLHEAVFSFAAKYIAHHLFRRTEFTPRQFRSACWFIRGYLSRLNLEKSSRMPSEPTPYTDESCPEWKEFESREFKLEEINEIEAWAATVLGKANDTPVQASSWEIHGSLIMFQLCSSQEGVVDIYQGRARKAIELNPKNWHACHFIAKQSSTSNEEAVELLSRAKQAVDELRRSSKTWMRDSSNPALLARITLDLGDRLWDLGKDYKLAAQTHRECLQYDYVHFVSYTEVLARYQKRKAWDEFIAFIEILNNTSPTWTAFFDELVNQFVVNLVSVRETNMLAEAADAAKRWDVIEAFFTLAIDIGIQQEACDLVFLLRDGFAKTLSASVNGEAQLDKIVSIQEVALEDVRLHRPENLSPAAVDAMADSLAQTYLSKAFEPDLPVEKVDRYGALLAGLLPDLSEVDVLMNFVSICCLVRYHCKRKSDSKLARDCMEIIVRTGIELLSDDDDDNDYAAYSLLAQALLIVGDIENARITWTLYNMLQYEAHVKWQNWMTTTGQGLTNGDEGSTNGLGGEHKAITSNGKDGSGAEPASEEPEKPEPIVGCDACGKQYVIVEMPVYTCADCVGRIHLCQECHALLMQDKLEKKLFNCKKSHEHAFMEIPPWDASLIERMPRGCVPLPDSWEGGRRWMTLDDWKGELRKLYLDGDAKEVFSPA
ncbi:hypothetical protein GGR54DRAFT_393194 [Hypoxylon sp. NC1633]|nr:hypothetical protein GGR54DRAFT_393194 [Hypoxylon sp. NC1633]